MHDFRRLDVWHEAVALAEVIYRLTETFPKDERFGLTSQMRRAAVSISSKIAEGAGRGSNPEMCRYLTYAMGSLAEVDSQIEFATIVGLLAVQPRLGGADTASMRPDENAP